MGLERTQRLFFDAVASPLPEDLQLLVGRDSGSAASFSSIATELIKPGATLTASERLSLYHKQYWYRLIDCLYDDFPGLRAVLGEKAFYKVVLSYLHTERSNDFNLRNLGQRMPEFVISTKLIPKLRSKAASDMARLEWASVEAFDNASLPVIDPNLLGLREISTLKLSLQPYITLLTLSYPWDQLICDLQRKERDRGEAATEQLHQHEKVKILKLPKRDNLFLVVHRFNSGIFYKRVSNAAFCFLSNLNEGKNLDAAFEEAAPFLTVGERENAAKTITEWFESWTALGWLVDFRGPIADLPRTTPS